MKILCIESACVYLSQMEQVFSRFENEWKQSNIEMDLLSLQEEVEGCHACGKCQKRRSCILDDSLNPLLEKIGQYDGILVGYDLNYGYPNTKLVHFLERLAHCGSDRLSYLPMCSLVLAKECDEDAFTSVDALFEMMNATILASYHHNVCHPNYLDESQIASIAKRFSWIVQCLSLGNKHGIEKPGNHEILRDFLR